MTYEEMLDELKRKKKEGEKFTAEEKTFMKFHGIPYEMDDEELALEISKTLQRYGELNIFEKEILSMRLEKIQKDLKHTK